LTNGDMVLGGKTVIARFLEKTPRMYYFFYKY